MLAIIVATCAVLYGVLCVFLHRFVWHTGQAVPHSALYTDAAGHSKKICFQALGGDLGTAVVAREIFATEVYMQHGIHVPATGSPLILDIGCNIGLFSMYVMERNPDALVVAAEPIPYLRALAESNTARYGQRVLVEPVGVAASAQSDVAFVVDPRITAGASMFEADITRLWKDTSVCRQLSVVLRDNVRALSLPATPFLRISSLLRVPVLRWLVLTALSPFLVLFVGFLLLGPLQKSTVRCACVPLAQLLARAAARMPDEAMRRRVLRGPIALVKVDVEGAEWEVLRGVTDAEWRRVEQIAVEVHDVEDRVRKVEQLLERQGFAEVHTTQEDWDSHAVLHIKSVFARRREAA
ncbi:31-O-demethyl-FK506 methyltransferase [Leptomonas pyrrhocoris]|uniref:31-O-demethyl-FK506 methyltransferase n=1 Tax=Leptomonas pyrrhocoris TaxID=157538 RepID=A0A0N0DSA3_LEPPY|nr:31-O-demethyl-FK506 methyltransferase [Leptomonas pyrrhocoris]KPA75622.1 31-O-demethyl-FK506 methyltransferase [Leptomonas pyrrhocoris]|eukprot:XP_015654061.1 31-O-demethyl-FK506 methyltransferase [Leptomonas pyrrhocoris]